MWIHGEGSKMASPAKATMVFGLFIDDRHDIAAFIRWRVAGPNCDRRCVMIN
jgi:hypothetical protein